MEGFFKFVGVLIGLYLFGLFVVAVVLPLVLFTGKVLLAAVVPTGLLLVLLMRETPQKGWLNRNLWMCWPAITIMAFLGAVILLNGSAPGSERQTLLIWTYAIAVYATAGLYLLYLSGHFVVRTLHFYRLPNLSQRHRTSDGRLSPEAVVRDAPDYTRVAEQTPWVSHNQALRAAQALGALTGSASTYRPDFIENRQSKVAAAGELIRAYTAYVRGFREEFMTQYEKELYDTHLSQQKP